MTKPELAMLKELEKHPSVLTWWEILSLPCDRKEYYARRSRNTDTANRLIRYGLLVHATPEQKAEWVAKYERETQRMKRHLLYAIEKNHWRVAERLVQHLGSRSLSGLELFYKKPIRIKESAA